MAIGQITTPRSWRCPSATDAGIKAGETPESLLMDQEARQEPLRLQEPCQRGPFTSWCFRAAATHDSKVLDDILDGQHGLGRVGGQRLSLGGDRDGAEAEGVEEPDPSQDRPFGAASCFRSNDMTLVRSVGLARAKARIEEPAYNMRRLVQLERLAAAV